MDISNFVVFKKKEVLNTVVSIIIPIYNVETYLNECVNSVLIQTFKDFEILLIDDGSKDSSGKLCDEIASTDSRIRVYHKPNGGLSSARNYGIDKASGKYIIFLDADDYWVDKYILSLLIEKSESKNLDVVRGELVNVDAKGKQLYTPDLSEESLKLKNQILGSYEMMKSVINGRFFSWLFMFRKSAIGCLRFDENRKFQEDIDFAIKFFSKNYRCGYLPIQFYAYRQRKNSIMSTPRISNLANSFALCDIFHEYAYKVEDKRLTSYYLYNAIMMYYWTLETVASDLYISQYENIEQELSLSSLQKKVYRWVKEASEFHFPVHLYVNPCVGVYFFRIRWWGGRIFRRFKIIR